jgi:hypothetical protein
MTAKEMFAECGLTEIADFEHYILIYGLNSDDLSITFYKALKYYEVSVSDGGAVDMELHKAITQKLKELRWIDEVTDIVKNTNHTDKKDQKLVAEPRFNHNLKKIWVGCYAIDMQMLKEINQTVRDLGWLDEEEQ